MDGWTWLLGRTASGLWRHVPHQARELGQGQDPRQEPRVEVIQRLIAYPEPVFEQVIALARALDRPEGTLRWLCYRQAGDQPARGYWLCFVSARENQRRFHFGLELYDRERLGLWIFSGYDSASARPELMAPFPSRPDVALPRLELTAETFGRWPVREWLLAAWEDRLTFEGDQGSTGSAGLAAADRSGVLDASMMADPGHNAGVDARADFDHAVFGSGLRRLPVYWNRAYFRGVLPPATLASDEAVRRFVASEPRAIGYVRIGAADGSVRVVLILTDSTP